MLFYSLYFLNYGFFFANILNIKKKFAMFKTNIYSCFKRYYIHDKSKGIILTRQSKTF